jgi:hypothetical protein
MKKEITIEGNLYRLVEQEKPDEVKHTFADIEKEKLSISADHDQIYITYKDQLIAYIKCDGILTHGIFEIMHDMKEAGAIDWNKVVKKIHKRNNNKNENNS